MAKNNLINSNLQEIKIWMLRKNLSFTDMGKVMCGLSGRQVHGNAVRRALSNNRMPVKNYQSLVSAYPDIPLEFLPEPIDIKPGPKPKPKNN